MAQPIVAHSLFGEALCRHPDYHCLTIERGDSWGTLFPDEEKRDIVRRVNRMNVFLQPGMTIAVPNNLSKLSVYDISPFPRYLEVKGEKLIYVDIPKLAWGAYSAEGKLVWWGPISPGSFTRRGLAKTPIGQFGILRKQGANCVSHHFPKRIDGDNGGAKMPFCMYFLEGYALHGSVDIPGFAASEGCVRLFIEDAKWLNEHFVELPGKAGKGTQIIIRDDKETI